MLTFWGYGILLKNAVAYEEENKSQVSIFAFYEKNTRLKITKITMLFLHRGSYISIVTHLCKTKNVCSK